MTSGTLFDLVVPLLISYMLLAILTVLNPLVAHGLRRLTVPRALGRGLPRQVIDVILQAVFQALLTFAWVQSTPTLIRPVWTWHNSVPPTTAIQPLQQFGFMLVILAALGGVARMMLEYRAARDPAVLVFAGSVSAEIARTPQQAGLSLPPRVGAVAQTAFLTLMLSGALNDWLDSISFFIVISLVLLGRSELVTRGAGWAALVSRVPLILRVLVAGVLSYLIALQVLTAMWAGTSTFRPVVIGTAASLILFGLLVPGRLAPVARPSAPPPRRVASHAS